MLLTAQGSCKTGGRRWCSIPVLSPMCRAAAVAAEQENKAKVEEMQAKVVEAEAQIPLALAEAFRSGNLGVMDYYRLNNIKADTDMRDSISKGEESS